MPDFINAEAGANGLLKSFLGILDPQSFTVELKSTWRLIGQNRDQPISILDRSTYPPSEHTGYVSRDDLAKMRDLASHGYSISVNPAMGKREFQVIRLGDEVLR
jgi:hypothetical protein